jgi:hypothetical protein
VFPTIEGMLSLVKAYREEADDIGHFMREYGQTDYGLASLLVHVRLWTGSHYYDELARLLTDALEAAGKNDEFSVDRLSKTWNRHGKKMQSLFSKFRTINSQMFDPPDSNPA